MDWDSEETNGVRISISGEVRISISGKNRGISEKCGDQGLTHVEGRVLYSHVWPVYRQGDG